jgi:hypothetical protein
VPCLNERRQSLSISRTANGHFPTDDGYSDGLRSRWAADADHRHSGGAIAGLAFGIGRHRPTAERFAWHSPTPKRYVTKPLLLADELSDAASPGSAVARPGLLRKQQDQPHLHVVSLRGPFRDVRTRPGRLPPSHETVEPNGVRDLRSWSCKFPKRMAYLPRIPGARSW